MAGGKTVTRKSSRNPRKGVSLGWLPATDETGQINDNERILNYEFKNFKAPIKRGF